jgi:hypothetical protein
MKDFGLVEELRSITDYVFGQYQMPIIPYVEDGNWEKWLPQYENQTTKVGDETSGCTVWGTLNAVETFMKRVYGHEPNYSERFTYLNVPIDPKRGADPHRTCETVRKFGVIDERDMPMTRTLQEYLSTADLTEKEYKKGTKWLENHDFKHEWLWSSRPANYIEVLKESLKTSPIGVSVSAWNMVDGVFVSYGNVNNHWCMLYKIDDEGYPWVFDSYDHTKKKLSKDHNIRRAKRFWIHRKTYSAMRRHIGILEKIVKMLSQKKTLLDVCKANLGNDASPKDVADDEVACAETVTTLLRQVYPEVPIITGTWTLYEYLNNPKNGFKKVTEPKAETIIISPTGSGRGVGHTGIFDEQGLIMSNNSFGLLRGKFTQNYTLPLWQSRYGVAQGMPILMFDRA